MMRHLTSKCLAKPSDFIKMLNKAFDENAYCNLTLGSMQLLLAIHDNLHSQED